MSGKPGTPEELIQEVFTGKITIPISDVQTTEHMIKAENVPDSDIEQLLNEIEIPKEEFERVKAKTKEILELTEEDCGKKMSTSLQRDLYITDERAKHIPRFEHIPMIYRDYVGIHSQRIQFIFGFFRPLLKKIFGNDFNDHYITLYAGVHDILEGLSPFGDIPTPLKLGLSKRSEEIMNLVERKLGQILIATLPLSEYWDEYDEDMLEDMITKKSVESQVLSYFDKVDGFIACFHELVAGNENFREPFANYIAIFKDIKSGKKLPYLQALFDWQSKNEEVKNFSEFADIDTLLKQEHRIEDFFGKCPTTESMKMNMFEDFGLPMYKAWKWYGKQMPGMSMGDAKLISGEDMVCLREREIVAPTGLY